MGARFIQEHVDRPSQIVQAKNGHGTFTTIIGGADEALFHIWEPGEIYNGQTREPGSAYLVLDWAVWNLPNYLIDYETPLDEGRDNIYEVRIRTNYDNGTFVDEDFAFHIVNSVPEASFDIGDIQENCATGTLTGLDLRAWDGAGADAKYVLVNDAGGRFAIDYDTGVVTVANGALIDYETASERYIGGPRSYSITVGYLEGSNVVPSNSQEFFIDVTDAADVGIGGASNDVLVMGDGNDFAYGGTGNDYLYMGDGDDTAVGEAGTDVLLGEGGNDALFGGDDQDYLFGGSGRNTMYGGAGVDVLISEGANDLMYGGAGGDYFYAFGPGPATAFGDDGNDIDVGSNGIDTFYGGDGQDYFYGQGGNDVAYGDAGVDVLLGQDGNDVLYGGGGVDYLFGGAGADTFVVQNLPGANVIQDFNRGEGDLISLQATGLNSFADVLSHTSDFGSFCVVTIDADTNIWIIGQTSATLQATDFTFS